MLFFSIDGVKAKDPSIVSPSVINGNEDDICLSKVPVELPRSPVEVNDTDIII
jgi:hypothetical protein